MIVDLAIRTNDLRIISALNRARVRFVVIGGVAVQYFGCRELNEVDDLDLLVDSDIETAKKLVSVLGIVSPTVQICVESVAKPGMQIPIKFAPFYTEILTATLDQDFDEIYANSIEETHLSESVRIISLPDLVEMKRSTVDNLRKHGKDIECLKAV